MAGEAGTCRVAANPLRIVYRQKQLACRCEVQRGTATDGAHHLHARALAVGPFDIDDFVALAHAEIDRLLRELVQFAHWRQRGVANVQAAFDEVAQFEQPHAQPVAAGFWSIDESAYCKVVQDSVSGRRVQSGLFADFLQRHRVLAGRQNVDQGEHTLDDLDDGRSGSIGRGFSHGSDPY